MSKFLGIDTSCYTTSVAVFDEAQGIIAEERIVLRVKTGNRGLSFFLNYGISRFI